MQVSLSNVRLRDWRARAAPAADVVAHLTHARAAQALAGDEPVPPAA